MVDAVNSNNVTIFPGTIHHLQNESIAAMHSTKQLSSHAIGLAETLKLGKILNMLPPTIIFYGIEIKEINDTEAVSQPVKLAAIKLANKITKFLVNPNRI